MVKKEKYENKLKFIIPKSIIYIISIIYLYFFYNIKITGFGKINAFQFINGRIEKRITGKNSKIGKKVTIKAVLNLEENVLIDDECYFMKGPVFIGKGTNIMFKSQIVGPVSIGRYCAIARKNIFQAQNHFSLRPSIQRSLYSRIFNEKLPSIEKGGINIGNDVWIGTNVIILSGVKIGDGAIIGAGSVVTKEVQPYSVVAGVPAVHKKYRFKKNTIKQLLDIKWWNWDEKKIKRNKTFFMTNLDNEDDLTKLIVE
jgi:virginiamycin A acetyltransferase